MKSSEKNTYKKIEEAFDNFFNDESYDFEIDAKVMASRCLSEIQEITQARNINRKELAEMIGTSASYLTQLYRGHKLMNWITLAKFKKALDLDIDIHISNNCYNKNIIESSDYYKKITLPHSNINWEIIKNISTYDSSEEKYSNSKSTNLNNKKITA